MAMDTWRILKLSRTVLLSMVAVLLVAIVLGAQVHRDAMQTIGKDAAPSIIAAQHIKSALADLDADEANILLAEPNTANAATAGVIRRREEADAALLAASGNVTYAAERLPIQTLQGTADFYNRLAQQTEDFHDTGNPLDVRYYRALAIIMDEKLLPAADTLDRANNDELQSAYHRQGIGSNLTRLLVFLVGLAGLAALVAIQIFLSRRTRRTLNPPLLAATLVTFFLFTYGLTALVTEQHRLKVAKEDSFESIHALWQARAVAYQANAEESRFLLDPANAGDYQSAFFSEVGALAKLPPGMSLQQLLAELHRGEKVPGFTGFLADELHNTTFTGEREAALRTLAAFETYLRIDGEVRALEHAGQHQQAVNLCVGTSPHQSDWAFERFDEALGETLDINQQEFNKAVDAGFASVGTLSGHSLMTEIWSTLEFKALVLSALIAVLIALGLAPRIREYE